ncbi:ABC transporter permease [Microaceticoccus formicicus]|uniref:ABC transporter permease n=1 Tax=Microaceticoccus formicicus TaxID=3118105 RepID=UPI003CD03420|nr:ABC transporter permease subunit [Peptoniphilaceae bacterium AMB_02]
MIRMFNLIRNENMKLYSRASTLVMYGILTVLVVAIAIIINFTLVDKNHNWKQNLMEENMSLEANISQMDDSNLAKKQHIKTMAINKYRIEKGIAPLNHNSFWGLIVNATSLISIISIFVIIIGTGILTSEFSVGTIKLLLIRPFKRYKILLSKYFTIILNSLSMLTTLLILSIIIGAIFFGFESINQPYLIYSNGAVREVNMLWYILSIYGYKSINLLMISTFAFMLSIIFQNNSLAIGLSILLLFTGSSIVNLLSRYTWSKYILFANTNLHVYMDGIPPVEGMTLGFSIGVLLIYYLIFMITPLAVFQKRDVVV